MICWPFPLHRSHHEPQTLLPTGRIPRRFTVGNRPITAISRSLRVICRKPCAEGCDPGEQSHHRHQE
jgi:hypothetical protein